MTSRLGWWVPLGLLASAAVAAGFYLGFERYLALVVLALVATAALPLVGRQVTNPLPGMALLLVVGVMLPFEMGGGINAPILVTVLLVGVWLTSIVVLRRRVALHPSRAVVAVLVFMGIALVSFLVGQFPWFPTEGAPIRAQIGGLALFLMSGGIFLLVGHQVDSEAQLQHLTWLFTALGTVATITLLVPWLDFAAGPLVVTNASTIGSGFPTWFVAITVSQAVWNRDLSPTKRAALLAVGGLALARGLLMAFSWKSGWFPPMVALGVILLLRFPRFTTCSALLLAAPVMFSASLMSDTFVQDEQYSVMTRGEALLVMKEIIERNPLLGLGPANYYYYTPLFPILGWRVSFNSHNNYVDLLAQTGIIGLIAFVWFALEAGALAWRLRTRAWSGFVNAYAIGALAGLAGALASGLLADWIVPFVYNIGLRGFRSSLLFWFFLGGLLALHRIASRPSPAAQESSHSRLRMSAPVRA